MNICFLLSYSPNPRIKKRINLLKEKYLLSLIYWKRTESHIYGNPYENIKTIEINILANNGNPLARLIPTIRFCFAALKKLKEIKPNCIYVENLDMLFIVRLYLLGKKNKAKIIYEISDIHTLLIDPQVGFVKKILQKILKKLDKRFCQNIDLLVNTSYKFYEVYYSKFVPKDKLIIVPNIPNLSVFKDYKPKINGEFTIGFIGLVRYKNQMKMLMNIADKSKFKILFAGGSIDEEIEKLCDGKDNIEYYGEYNYNEEIAKLYAKVDCIYSVYDADLFNVRIALPNKLYEAIYCEIPIIVARGTYLSEIVEEMGVGISVSHTDENELNEVMNRLSSDKKYVNSFVEACRTYKSDINPDTYNEQLKNKINQIIDRKVEIS